MDVSINTDMDNFLHNTVNFLENKHHWQDYDFGQYKTLTISNGIE